MCSIGPLLRSLYSPTVVEKVPGFAGFEILAGPEHLTKEKTPQLLSKSNFYPRLQNWVAMLLEPTKPFVFSSKWFCPHGAHVAVYKCHVILFMI